MRHFLFATWLLFGGATWAQDAPTPVAQSPIRISGPVMAGNLITKVAPVYPEAAKAAQVSGVVTLRVIIGKDGHPRDIAVVSGPDLLRQPALDAVRQWVYRPYQLTSGEATEVETTVPVNFQLVVAPPPAANGTEVHVSGLIIAGQLLYQAKVDYPPIAKAAHITGTVVLNAIIGKDGHVKNLSVVSGPPMLQGTAMDSVRRWVYRPWVANGQAVEVHTTIAVNFGL